MFTFVDDQLTELKTDLPVVCNGNQLVLAEGAKFKGEYNYIVKNGKIMIDRIAEQDYLERSIKCYIVQMINKDLDSVIRKITINRTSVTIDDDYVSRAMYIIISTFYCDSLDEIAKKILEWTKRYYIYLIQEHLHQGYYIHQGGLYFGCDDVQIKINDNMVKQFTYHQKEIVKDPNFKPLTLAEICAL